MPGRFFDKQALSRYIVSANDAGAFSARAAGHTAFSPVTISDGSLDWYRLGPHIGVAETAAAGYRQVAG
ncbi:MAG: hypothetical protein KA801_00395 [Syntrophorhabdaceae bacterium]|nr:hypothetical protein [Syntrophorhabdaceae bacterium]